MLTLPIRGRRSYILRNAETALTVGNGVNGWVVGYSINEPVLLWDKETGENKDPGEPSLDIVDEAERNGTGIL